MPFIEETDLLDLHKDIEKAQIINERLLDQIKFKNKDLKKLKIQMYSLMGILAIFLLSGLVLFSYVSGATSMRKLDPQDQLLVSIDSLEAIKARIDNLKQKNDELNLVNEFYLAKQFLDKEIIYSVQVKSFVDNNVALASESLTNTMFVKTHPFYAYSVGNFETLEQAQHFRRQLVDIGFKDAFVASYQDGKRLKIERPD